MGRGQQRGAMGRPPDTHVLASPRQATSSGHPALPPTLSLLLGDGLSNVTPLLLSPVDTAESADDPRPCPFLSPLSSGPSLHPHSSCPVSLGLVLSSLHILMKWVYFITRHVHETYCVVKGPCSGGVPSRPGLFVLLCDRSSFLPSIHHSFHPFIILLSLPPFHPSFPSFCHGFMGASSAGVPWEVLHPCPKALTVQTVILKKLIIAGMINQCHPLTVSPSTRFWRFVAAATAAGGLCPSLPI